MSIKFLEKSPLLGVFCAFLDGCLVMIHFLSKPVKKEQKELILSCNIARPEGRPDE